MSQNTIDPSKVVLSAGFFILGYKGKDLFQRYSVATPRHKIVMLGLYSFGIIAWSEIVKKKNE